MVIETRGGLTAEEARELINISSSYRDLKKNPEAKLKDFIRESMVMIIISLVLIVLLTVTHFISSSVLNTVGLILAAVCLAASIAFHILLRTRIKAYIKTVSTNPKKIILDENGIEMVDEGVQKVSLAWKNVYMVRAFSHIIIFLSNEASGVSIVASVDHKDEIFGYIKDNHINVKTVG